MKNGGSGDPGCHLTGYKYEEDTMQLNKELTQDRRETLEKIFQEIGFNDFKWMDPRKIIVAQWVRMKCKYGCSGYGSNANCPPNTPSVAECERFFSEYNTGVILPFVKQVNNKEEKEELSPWYKSENKRLLDLERAVFLKGYQKAFVILMNPCNACAECGDANRNCYNPKMSRPTPEGLSVDVYSTVRSYGLPIQVTTDYDQEMNRYGFLLIQ